MSKIILITCKIEPAILPVAKKTEIIGRTCSICKHIKIGDVLKQLNIDKNDLDEDCQGCLGSEVTECK